MITSINCLKVSNIFLFLTFVSFFIFTSKSRPQIAQSIPENRITDWQNSGLTFKKRNHSREDVLNIKDFEIPEQKSWNKSFLSAMDSGEKSGRHIIFFPEGKYFFDAPVTIGRGVIIKGAGPNNTILRV